MSKFIGSFEGGIQIELILHNEPRKHESPIAAIVLNGPIEKCTKKTIMDCLTWLKEVFQQIVDEHKWPMIHTFDIAGKLETWLFSPDLPAKQIA